MSGVAGQAHEVRVPTLGGPFRGDRARLLSAAGIAGFIVISALFVAVNGIFLSRDVIFLWILLGLFAVSLSDLTGFFRGVLTDWLPFFAALFAYDLLRGLLADSLLATHTLPQIRADELLFGGQVPTVWLQERLFDPASLHWYDFAAWAVYLTHFFAVFVIAAHLWRVARPRFRRFRNLILGLTAAALLTYVLFPAAPPWLASDGGELGPAQRVVGAVWGELGVSPAAALWEKGSSFANEVAAIPSLHTAYPVMILLFFWPTGSPRVRACCLAYALAMSATLVYTAEHYVVDVILGWAYAGIVYVAVARLSVWWRRRSTAARRSTAETTETTGTTIRET